MTYDQLALVGAVTVLVVVPSIIGLVAAVFIDLCVLPHVSKLKAIMRIK